jgi:hypothetical protein
VAAKTRPWVLSEQRLAEHFPKEQQASVELLIGLLHEPIARLQETQRKPKLDVAITAAMVYQLTFATLRSHLVAGNRPAAEECEALVGFCLRGVRP